MSISGYSSEAIDRVIAPPIHQERIWKKGSVSITIPKSHLASKSLKIEAHSSPYFAWSVEDSSNAYAALKKTVDVWNKNNFASQYLVYGKQQPGDMPFSWEIVPYQNKNTFIGRIWQQFLVLWRITFGGKILSESQRQKEFDDYRTDFNEEFIHPVQDGARNTMNAAQSDDAFCKKEVIDKQLVLGGKTVNVLYNYAPIGFGGEKLHFLIVPKEHKKNFAELSEEEYLEAAKLSKGLMRYFLDTREIEDVHLFHKTGGDAGQTVPHWHMHMIFTCNKVQNFFGKLTVLKNMLIGSSPMPQEELRKKVTSLKSELTMDSRGD